MKDLTRTFTQELNTSTYTNVLIENRLLNRIYADPKYH